MNSAAKLMSQNVVSRSGVISLLLSKTHLSMIAMSLLLLTSALSIVYVTNSSRTLNAAVQQTLAERDQLRLQWGQLLLERGTWDMQARVQKIAEGKLGMVIPDSHSIMVISERSGNE